MTNALFLGTSDDEEYVPMLKHMFNGVNTYVLTAPIEFLTHLEMYCVKRNITAVVSTNLSILQKLVATQGNPRTNPSLADYQGSLFTYKNLEVVFISPLRQLFTVPYGKFIAERFISKVVAAKTWPEPTEFKWNIFTPENLESTYNEFSKAYAIAVDIETFRDPLSIRCIGYTAVFISALGAITTKSGVLPIDSTFSVAWMRRFNSLPVQKIFQKGKYDVSYLLRYNAAPENWLWDTANLFHSWYSELPKDLAFLNAFFLRKVVYWKDLAETSDIFEYYRYNALDTWATANVWIQQMLRSPEWARRNYQLEFPLNYPCLLAEMTGIRRDMDRLKEERDAVDAKIEKTTNSLRKILSLPAFNTNSPTQVKSLLAVFSSSDIQSTEEKDLKKVAYRHPYYGRIIGMILDVRGWRKLASTYLRLPEDANSKNGWNGGKEFYGRVLYALLPEGTDSGRLASREHHFWCGLQIQNIPVGKEVKRTLRAEDGWYIGECDLEQAETRDTAYLAGERNLISAVESPRDFHSINIEAFWGLKYNDVYDDVLKKTKNKPIRDISKRTNHGATYNMGEDVLVDTMGLEAVWQARKLLKLDKLYKPRDITAYLLTRFHATYPGLRGPDKPFTEGTYYAHIVREISTSKRLVSRAFHRTEYNCTKFPDPKRYIEEGDWVRWCFGNPEKSKPHLNSYVSHPSQSLNARTLNEAWMRVFYEVALPNPTRFRLHAQIHDSILFSYRAGFQHLAAEVQRCMCIPVTVRNIRGEYCTFTVPAALKLGSGIGTDSESRSVYWSDTE